MSEDPRVKVARDLTEILRLYGDLEEQAINDAGAHLMPGGRAMVELGPVTNLERWENMTAAGERLGRAYTSAEDEDPDDAWSAFQLIEFWAEAWRRELGAEYDGARPTIATEANFVRHALEWAWENEPGWEDMARDINRARVRLEDILTDGRRVERTRVTCSAPDCFDAQKERGYETPWKRTLIRLVDDHGREDIWKCPGCHARLDREGFDKAYAAMLRSQEAAKYLSARDAIDLLKGQGEREHTVRRWMSPPVRHAQDRCTVCRRRWPAQEYPACPGLRDGEECGGELRPVLKRNRDAIVGGFCDIETRKTWVWWPDFWTQHLLKKAEEKSA